MYPWSRFKGDNNEILKIVQNGCYWSLAPHLFTTIRERYMWSIHYIGIETDLSKVISHTHEFDHRILQRPYEKIAAYYRYQYEDHDGQLMLPYIIPDHPDLSTEDALVEYYKREWCKYYYVEVNKIAAEASIARAVLTAIALENTDDGYEAEELIHELLHDRYGKSWDTDVQQQRKQKRKSHTKNMILPHTHKKFEPWA